MIGSKLVVFRYVALRLLGSLLGSALSLTIDVYIVWCGRACCAVFFVLLLPWSSHLGRCGGRGRVLCVYCSTWAQCATPDLACCSLVVLRVRMHTGLFTERGRLNFVRCQIKPP
jgi:hypothetical protein